MKAIHINPFEKTVKEVDILGNLEDIYVLLGCRPLDAINYDDKNVLYVDDEGLLKNDQRYFSINGFQMTMLNNHLLISYHLIRRWQMSNVLKAVKEASISVACLLDDIAVDENNDINIFEIEKDIEHIQDQITIIENHFEEVSDE
jgi:hypothetical protein